jgi:hypothetical protein
MQSPTLNWGLVKDVVGATPLYSPLGIQANAYEWKVPIVYQWNFGMQWKMPHALTLDVAYVGSSLPEALRVLLQNVGLKRLTTLSATIYDGMETGCWSVAPSEHLRGRLELRLNGWTEEHPRWFVAAAALLVFAISLGGSAAGGRCLFETLWMAAATGFIAAAGLAVAMVIRARREHA